MARSPRCQDLPVLCAALPFLGTYSCETWHTFLRPHIQPPISTLGWCSKPPYKIGPLTLGKGGTWWGLAGQLSSLNQGPRPQKILVPGNSPTPTC